VKVEQIQEAETSQKGFLSPLRNQPPFLQSFFWAKFKSRHGWKPYRFVVSDSVDFECSVLVREFKLPFFGKVALAYVPMGIYLDSKTELKNNSKDYASILLDFSKEICQFLPKKTLCIRYDIPLDFSTVEEAVSYAKTLEENSTKVDSKLKCKKSPYNVQPADTVVLDLSLSEEAILEQMKSKWRYNIRLAEKKGVEVRKANSSEIDVFYNLYKTTAERDGIAIHAKEYYADLLNSGSYDLENTSDNDEERSLATKYPVTLYIASHEGEDLAAIITLFTPKEGVYLYGASSNNKRNLMPAYLLQWRAICDAKKAGSSYYDFYGMPPTEDENHPMHGLYRFKTGFGGQIVHRPGSIDVPLSKLYTFYTLAEKLRSFWYKKIKKKLVGR